LPKKFPAMFGAIAITATIPYAAPLLWPDGGSVAVSALDADRLASSGRYTDGRDFDWAKHVGAVGTVPDTIPTPFSGEKTFVSGTMGCPTSPDISECGAHPVDQTFE
jgi:hypothetical protein